MKATNRFEILDCTLRDGGYYTNWDFEDLLVEKYFSSMNNLPIDILEIGYRSVPHDGYLGKYYYFPDFVANHIAKINQGKTLALMFNEKDTRPEHLERLLDGLNGIIGLIRLAVDPEKFERALLLAESIRERGFEVGFNVMYMYKYADNEDFLVKLPKVNEVVKYLNIVDSYGGLMPNQVKSLINLTKSLVNVKVGYHAHNNLELAFANTLTAIDAGCQIVDCTVTGMGRGAGNLKTELLLTYLASINEVDFDFNELSALIEAWTPLHKQHEWGTNLPYMVSGANSLPQKDVMNWVTQRFYSFNSIIRALNNQSAGEKDNIKLPVYKPQRTYENVVIIGGGPNAIIHSEAVKNFISKKSEICIIHASSKNAKCFENIEVEQIFCLVGNEGHRLEDVFKSLDNFDGTCVLPPYPRKMGTYIPEKIKLSTYELSVIDFTDKFQDSHTALALQTALEIKAKNVYLAGYDGYPKELISSKEQGLIAENEYSFNLIKQRLNLVSILPTQYNIDEESVYALVV